MDKNILFTESLNRRHYLWKLLAKPPIPMLCLIAPEKNCKWKQLIWVYWQQTIFSHWLIPQHITYTDKDFCKAHSNAGKGLILLPECSREATMLWCYCFPSDLLFFSPTNLFKSLPSCIMFASCFYLTCVLPFHWHKNWHKTGKVLKQQFSHFFPTLSIDSHSFRPSPKLVPAQSLQSEDWFRLKLMQEQKKKKTQPVELTSITSQTQ